MKILFFSPYFYPYLSGLTIYPFRVLNYLSKKHKITVLTFNHLNNSLKIKNLKFKIVALPYRFRISKGFISLHSVFEFWKQSRKNEIIILNQPNFEGLPLAIFGQLFGKKIISIIHCQVFLSKSFINLIINFFLNLSFYLQLWLSDVIVSTTQDYANSLLFGYLFKNKIKTTFPPIPLSSASLANIKVIRSKKKNNIWIGYVGRIAHEKGLEYLVQSIKQLNLVYKNIKLIFAGPDPVKVAGENNYWQKLKKQLKKQKIDYLFFKDLSDNQLSAFYRTIDVLVLPSVNQTEALGMVQVEAMFSGIPVIATNLPGVRIPVKLTKMGIVVPPKNSKAINQAIKKILKNRKKYTNQKLVAQAKQIFDIKKTFNFYDSLIKTYEKKS